jgi:hypothetical protein
MPAAIVADLDRRRGERGREQPAQVDPLELGEVRRVRHHAVDDDAGHAHAEGRDFAAFRGQQGLAPDGVRDLLAGHVAQRVREVALLGEDVDRAHDVAAFHAAHRDVLHGQGPERPSRLSHRTRHQKRSLLSPLKAAAL